MSEPTYGGPVVSVEFLDPGKGQDCLRCVQYKSFFARKFASLLKVFQSISDHVDVLGKIMTVFGTFTDTAIKIQNDLVGGMQNCSIEPEFEWEATKAVTDMAPTLPGVKPDKCGDCGGEGALYGGASMCYECGGTGYGLFNGVIDDIDISEWEFDGPKSDKPWFDPTEIEKMSGSIVLTKDLLEKGYQEILKDIVSPVPSLVEKAPTTKGFVLPQKHLVSTDVPCPKCGGISQASCILCDGDGMVSKEINNIFMKSKSKKKKKMVSSCETCEGTGKLQSGFECMFCFGTGLLPD